MIRKLHIICRSAFLLCVIACACFSCEKDTSVYHVCKGENCPLKQDLTVWEICDSAYSGVYTPKYGQLDLREVYGIAPTDTAHSLRGKTSRIRSYINVDADTTLYLNVATVMPCTLLLNGDTLSRRDIQGLNIYPLALRKGKNTLAASLKTDGDDLSFESTLCDSLTVGRIFAEGQSGNIIYALVTKESKAVMLTNAHQNVLAAPVKVAVHDVRGHLLREFTLKKDSFVYAVPEMHDDESYMVSMTMAGTTVRQPVLCGKDDDASVKFHQLRASLEEGHPRAGEIDQLLYRLDFLLAHPSRYEGDWWWQFKIPAVTYQLEHAFAHLDSTYGTDDTEANIQFITYPSAQDDSVQRYILARPNAIPASKPLPLVVIVRPHVVNKHHFFASPQLSRQWAVNQMQALANRYGFLVVMPEMRLSQGEDITAKSTKELLLALQDVKSHYPVDTTRLFLHANCSGGFRALQLATAYPHLFAAIALYAPAYQSSNQEATKALRHDIAKLKGMPLFIHGDPIDGHSPYRLYKDLVADCRKHRIPLTLSMKRNSGKFYNVTLVGEEAFGFFASME